MHINDSINSIHPRKSSVCFRLTFYLRSIHARLGLSTSSMLPFSHSGRAPLPKGSRFNVFGRNLPLLESTADVNVTGNMLLLQTEPFV